MSTQKTGLELLAEDVATCRHCALSSNLKAVAAGSAPAEVAYITPQPLLEEQSEPEIAALTGIITRLEKAWWVSSVVKCAGRLPSPAELVECSAYFRTELLYVQPRLVVGFGRDVAAGLELYSGPGWRGRVQDFEGTPVVVTYALDYIARKATAVERKRASADVLRAVGIVFGRSLK